MRVRAIAYGLIVLATPAAVLADGRVTLTDATFAYNGPNPGGAFTVRRSTPAANGDYNGIYGDNRLTNDGRPTTSFLTFCLESTEFVNLNGTTQYYTEISTSTQFGGAGGGSPDPLSHTTAYIYREFRSLTEGATDVVNTAGKFNGLLGSTLSTTETRDIQMAIWYSEGERQWSDLSTLAQSIYTWANTNNDGRLGGVRVLRLWTNWTQANGYSGPAQDMLTIVPLPPAAWAGIASLAGIGAFGYVRRRSFRA